MLSKRKLTRQGMIYRAALSAVFLFFGVALGASAQMTCFDYLDQALTKVVTQASQQQLDNYDYRPGNCLYGAFLKEGEDIQLQLTLSQGSEYVILGGADNDVNDLDLSLLNAEGIEVVSDMESDPTPIMRYTPRHTGKYTIQMTNYDSDNDSFCVFVILQKTGNGHLDIDQITEALRKIMVAGRMTAIFSSCHFATGSFCLFGGEVRRGEDSSIFDTRPQPTGKFALISAGDRNIKDLNAFIHRQSRQGSPEGTIIESTTEEAAISLCTFSVRPGEYYQLRHKVVDARSRSGGFVFSILMQLED